MSYINNIINTMHNNKYIYQQIIFVKVMIQKQIQQIVIEYRAYSKTLYIIKDSFGDIPNEGLIIDHL